MSSGETQDDLISLMKIEPAEVTASLITFIRTNMDRLEREGIILGLSGGIDSAVVATLCARAVGAEKVLALIMPEKDSRRQHIRDALDLGSKLNIETRLINITPYLDKIGSRGLFSLNRIPVPGRLKSAITKKAYHFFERTTGETPFSASLAGFKGKRYRSYLAKGNAYYRIKHRIRMVLLYLYAELENRLVVGAANKTEYRIGFFVKHGCDDASDIMPILGLYKTQVRELARYLEIPAGIIEKAPSPDIVPGLVDEEAIGMPYGKLDLILLALERGLEIREIADLLGATEREISSVKTMTERSEHMRTTYVPDIRR